MREPLRVFYYPSFWPDPMTLVKSILLFDEIHFMDRPSFMFGQLGVEFGTVGCASPMRQFEKAFRDGGVPIYVHDAPGGPVHGKFLERIKADITDKEFLIRFQRGLIESPRFRDLIVQPGNYGDGRDQSDIVKLLVEVPVDMLTDPLAALADKGIKPFDTSTPDARAKLFVMDATTCSTTLNFGLHVSSREGFTPLADANPFQSLLATKYSRAIDVLGRSGTRNVRATDLSFSLFDELLPTEQIENLDMEQVVQYRRESSRDREAFLEHLYELEAKLGAISTEVDYHDEIRRVIDSEVRPAIRTFRNALDSTREKLYGRILKSAAGFAVTSDAVRIFGDLSWPHLLGLAGLAGGGLLAASVDALLENRAARRECSISYLLDLGDRIKVRSSN
jgi:hypothetical protein